MNRTLFTFAISVLFSASSLVAQVNMLEQWTFSEANDTPIYATTSNLGNALVPESSDQDPQATVQNQSLQLLNSGSAFLRRNFSVAEPDPFTSGVYEVSWDYPSVDMDGSTDGVHGFEFEDSANVAFAFIRLRVAGTDLSLQYVAGDTLTSGFSTLDTFSGRTLSDLTVTARIDLDQDLIDVSYTLGAGPEVVVLSGSAITPADFQGYRFIQQHSDTGGSDFTDSFIVDNYTLSAVPEPSFFALLSGALVACFVATRRRRS